MRRKMLDLEFGAFTRGEVAYRKDLAAAATIFDAMRHHLDDQLFAITAPDRRFGWPVARRGERETIHGAEPMRRIAADQLVGPDAEQRTELAVGLKNAFAVEDRQTFQGRVGEPAQVGEQSVEKGTDQDEPDEP